MRERKRTKRKQKPALGVGRRKAYRVLLLLQLLLQTLLLDEALLVLLHVRQLLCVCHGVVCGLLLGGERDVVRDRALRGSGSRAGCLLLLLLLTVGLLLRERLHLRLFEQHSKRWAHRE